MKTKTTYDFQSMTSTQQLAEIFREKDGIPGSPSRLRLEENARRCDHCREVIGVDPETGKEKKGRRCKTPMCPTCEARKSKINFRVLYDQFEEFINSGRLRQIRIDLDCGNVRGRKKLSEVLKALHKAWIKLTRSSVWKDVVVKAGAIIHLPRKESPSGHSAGCWIHLHIVVLTRTRRRKFEHIINEYRRILHELSIFSASFGGEREVITVRDANHLRNIAGYLAHIRKRIVGFPAKGSSTWLLWDIPDEDITAYIDSTKNKLRVLQRGFDPDILKISRRRRRHLPPETLEPEAEPSKQEMASTYLRLSMENYDGLVIRFASLSTYILKKCEPLRPCGVRACPRCLQRRLQYESGLITGARRRKGEKLVSFLLRLPRLVEAVNLESEAAAVYIAVGKFLRNSSIWPQKPSAFVFRLRARPVFSGGQTRFRLHVRILMSMRIDIDKPVLKKRWKKQLKKAGLPCRPKGKKSIILIREVIDLNAIVPRLVGDVKAILGPVQRMNPEAASTYLHVLAMRSDLFVTEEWLGAV